MARFVGIADFKPKEVTRIGRISDSRPRLVRFKCNDMKEKTNLLRLSKKLIGKSLYKNVFVNPDRTPKQRVKYNLLREELRSRRELGEDVMIHRGRVIQTISLQKKRKEIYRNVFTNTDLS